ncbi:hypothetical protein [Mycolicibacterium sp. J2]|uniref:hypothetical protein n=1 Tax=Mycolicibacterium sp. J2 TaxID=2993511 RepID=UPI00224A8B3E|nr:hypothetical protein [Mycolicibacterium sp. J2]MCX2710793.1 hypothetical protein [Mycolicibacterium sp. J2]
MAADTDPPPPAPAPAPEVRQQQDPDADHFGAVAVAAGPDRWGVMSPQHGGHWATDAEVKDWAVKQ